MHRIFPTGSKRHRKALRIQECVLGQDALYTLLSMRNLAEAMNGLASHEAAEPLARRSLEGLQKLSGNELEMKHCVNVLASILQDLGKTEEERNR